MPDIIKKVIARLLTKLLQWSLHGRTINNKASRSFSIILILPRLPLLLSRNLVVSHYLDIMVRVTLWPYSHYVWQ